MRYQFTDATEKMIRVTTDEGQEYFVPTDPANRDYAKILEEQPEIEPYVEEPV
jgi:hypothetical protein